MRATMREKGNGRQQTPVCVCVCVCAARLWLKVVRPGFSANFHVCVSGTPSRKKELRVGANTLTISLNPSKQPTRSGVFSFSDCVGGDKVQRKMQRRHG